MVGEAPSGLVGMVTWSEDEEAVGVNDEGEICPSHSTILVGPSAHSSLPFPSSPSSSLHYDLHHHRYLSTHHRMQITQYPPATLDDAKLCSLRNDITTTDTSVHLCPPSPSPSPSPPPQKQHIRTTTRHLPLNNPPPLRHPRIISIPPLPSRIPNRRRIMPRG